MATSNEYSKRAEKCFRLAREAKTETDRLSCLDLAQKWLEASLRQSETSSEQMAETQKLERLGKLKPEQPQLQVQSGWLQRLFGFFRRDYTPDTVAGTKVPKFIHGE
jgi:hypothetical protein